MKVKWLDYPFEKTNLLDCLSNLKERLVEPSLSKFESLLGVHEEMLRLENENSKCWFFSLSKIVPYPPDIVGPTGYYTRWMK